MKKVLLTAASTLVFTAAAGAQTVSLSGEASIHLAYDGSSNTFSGFNNYWTGDEGIYLTANGSGGGWNYEITHNLFSSDFDYTEFVFSNDVLGSFKIYGPNSVEWEREILGEILATQAFFDPSNIEEVELTLHGTAQGIRYEFVLRNDATRDFGFEIYAPIMGVDVGLTTWGSLHDTSSGNLQYHFEIEADLFGVDTFFEFGNSGPIGVAAALGAFYLETDLSDGDAFNQLALGYNNELSDMLEIQAYLQLLPGQQLQGGSAVVMRF